MDRSRDGGKRGEINKGSRLSAETPSPSHSQAISDLFFRKNREVVERIIGMDEESLPVGSGRARLGRKGQSKHTA
jgi:hypothetical protein